MQPNFLEFTLTEIDILLSPIVERLEDGEPLERILFDLKWIIPEIEGYDQNDISDHVNAILGGYQALKTHLVTPPQDFEAFSVALESVRAMFDAIRELADNFDNSGFQVPTGYRQIGEDIIANLFDLYLQANNPLLHRMLILIGLLTPADENTPSAHIENSNGKPIRFPFARSEMHLDRIKDMINNPFQHLKSIYLPNGSLINGTDVSHTANLLFPRLAAIMSGLGINSSWGSVKRYGFDFGVYGDEVVKDMLNVFHYTASQDLRFGATFALSSLDRGNLGFVVTPFGDLNLDFPIGKWNMKALLSLGLEGFAIGPEGLTLPSNFGGNSVQAHLSLDRISGGEEPDFVIGEPNGTRIQIGEIGITGGLVWGAAIGEAFIELSLKDGKFFLASPSSDGFLGKVLPSEGLEIDFAAIVGFSNINGFYFKGSGGLELLSPIHLNIADVLLVKNIKLAIRANENGIHQFASTAIELHLGPFSAIIEDLGFSTNITFPNDGGNLGQADISMGFKPPTGIGLSLDTGAVKGGGFISFDPENNRYTGVLELTIKETISVKAIGILTTELPGGQDGYSLLLLITAEFTPIQLGFGFTLNGVGGLIGVNRTMDLEKLRLGVKANTLDNILFPSDPVANAPQIISDLETIFPPMEGRYSFGLMGIIGWGTPTLIALEMGLMIEVPEPVRIAILGVVKALLPDENHALLKLQVNFLGTIDFERKLLTFDASLFDSRLLNFTLAGDMAVRMKWGDNPAFLFTVGGFHPDFNPPPLALPSLQRLTVNLMGGNNPRLTLKAYFAVTSNTVQFGSRIEFYFRVTEKIRVEGFLGFDALFQFSPFAFNIQFSASLAVFWNERTMLSIFLRVLLEGPTPWHAQGMAEFTILGIKCKVEFDKRWGDNANTTLPNIAILPKLKAALELDGAWQAIQPDNKVQGVTIRKSEPTTGSLLSQPETIFGIQQKIVPLGVSFSKFSNQRPSDHNHFDLKIFDGNTDLTGNATKEFFAPNDFFDLSNSQKVSRPSFEQFNAGKKASLAGGEELTGDLFREKDLVYDCFLMDSRNDPKPMAPRPESTARYNAMVRNGATARSLNASKAKGKSVRAPKRVAVKKSNYCVARISTMGHHDNLSAASEMEARELIRNAILLNPELENDLQVLPLFELA